MKSAQSRTNRSTAYVVPRSAKVGSFNDDVIIMSHDSTATTDFDLACYLILST